MWRSADAALVFLPDTHSVDPGSTVQPVKLQQMWSQNALMSPTHTHADICFGSWLLCSFVLERLCCIIKWAI